ncbi:MAG: 1-deoxy-D-xylulose-5-phosphate synthase [Lentisphaeria bacterium]|jgi:1-deoxy-D-xylulose-5-phosphate synthase
MPSSRPLLDQVQTPAAVRELPAADLPRLAAEIRAELLATVAAHGGHLASNLGAVELTLALLRAFDPSHDVVIWDTGHQSYAWKLLTGRRELFHRLRQTDGCCGFTLRQESPADPFGAGHAGTAISAALGFAAARDRQGASHRVVAVVGDGALGCGPSLEGLNNIVETTRDFILVVNDNKMSIARNVGAIARHLNRLIADKGYNRLKTTMRRGLSALPVVGGALYRLIHHTEAAAKRVVLGSGAVSLFEGLGLRYIGPIDGHDLPRLAATFEAVRNLDGPIVVHVLTEKGHGYPPAEEAPEQFHGVGPFDPEGALPAASAPSFAAHLGGWLARECPADHRLLAITAGMTSGTGLAALRERCPGQLIDVGIAEEHAVVFAAGLAAAGFRPVVAIYASFMQRAMDYVFHDVCLQNLPVVFCLDRAGIVEDGPTHHGIHDLGFWLHLPNLAVLQPADGPELEAMLAALRHHDGPALLRYPRGTAAPLPVPHREPLHWGKAEILRTGPDLAIWASGRETATALEVAQALADRGVAATVVNPRFLTPFDAALLRAHAEAMPVVTLENHVLPGGLASRADAALARAPRHRGLLHLGWPTTVLPWGAEAEIRRQAELDPPAITRRIAAWLATGTA